MKQYNLPEELMELIENIEMRSFMQGMYFDEGLYNQRQDAIDQLKEQVHAYVQSLGQQAQPGVPSGDVEPGTALE